MTPKALRITLLILIGVFSSGGMVLSRDTHFRLTASAEHEPGSPFGWMLLLAVSVPHLADKLVPQAL